MRRARPLWALLVLVATVLATTGCSLRGHTAFEVDGVRTTQNHVVVMAESCASVVDPFPWANMSALVSDMIHAVLARAVAEDSHLFFSDEELRSPIQAGRLGEQYKAMLDDEACATLVIGLTLEAAIKESVGTTTYTRIAGQIPVVINPRFGTWNSSDLTVDGSGSLSKADK